MSLADSPLVREYLRRTPGSARLAAEARRVLPSGITHDSRYLLPYPLYVARAAASRKWDVDGNEFVDYSGGHGALLCGHNPPEVVAAVSEQLARGTHYGAAHELEVRWAEQVCRLIPSAQKVRFTSSGTEATLLALRLARAFTGRSKIVRLAGHFHGWHDHVAFGVSNRFEGSASPGVLPELAERVLLVPPGDVTALARLLADQPDVAAVMFEPTGASWGQIPLDPAYVHAARELTAARGVLLIFDEVITGFRCAPGGAQAALGITPDLTTLAKILAGGLPGGAVAGRSEILEWLEFPPLATGETTGPSTAPPAASSHPSGSVGSLSSAAREKISHHGTYNANPLSAAAGVAMLDLVAHTDACERANRFGQRLREALDRVLRDERTGWCAYGSYSGFHLFTNPRRLAVNAADLDAGRVEWRVIKEQAPRPVLFKLRLGMLNHGVEIFSWPGGPTSSVHTDDDLEQTVAALRHTVRALQAEGDLS